MFPRRFARPLGYGASTTNCTPHEGFWRFQKLIIVLERVAHTLPLVGINAF